MIRGSKPCMGAAGNTLGDRLHSWGPVHIGRGSVKVRYGACLHRVKFCGGTVQPQDEECTHVCTAFKDR